MLPTNSEIEAAIAEKTEAMKEFALASSQSTKASLRVMAARKRLSLARSNEWALTNDMIRYAK